MFTGIIESTGTIKSLKKAARNIELEIGFNNKKFLTGIKTGASIAVNGVCLTATKIRDKTFSAFVSTETFSITNLKDLKPNSVVNLERSMKLNGRLDGHIVLGHIDKIGIITGIYKLNQDYTLKVRIPSDLLRYTISKGSIAINGISLTIAQKKSGVLTFSIIPETYRRTNIPKLKNGDKVNIEVDMFAKYIENFKK